MQRLDNLNSCDCSTSCSRREFIGMVGAALGLLSLQSGSAQAGDVLAYRPAPRPGATVRAAFLYPPSTTFSNDPKGWWSWPGTDYDAEGHQQQYAPMLGQIEKDLGVKLRLDDKPVATAEDARRLAGELAEQKPDGLLLMMFYNNSLSHANLLLAAAEKAGIPAILFVGLGVHHGAVTAYRRPGLYFIQALDDFDAIEYGLRMINAKKHLSQSLLLRIVEAPKSSETVEPFLGVRMRIIPFARYAATFRKVALDGAARQVISQLTGNAREIHQVTPEALENALRAHLALKTLLAEEGADAVTMNCLRQGMLKPCISFSIMNGELIPSACENDMGAALTQMLGQQLTGRGGFQHNPAFDTENNRYYASHCTCTTKLHGPDAPPLPYMLRHFMHTNEGSCAIQVFWKEGDPVTMLHYYTGKVPQLDVYAGKVFKSYPAPPAAGCTTNVAIELTDRSDAGMVKGHHNILYCGDFARQFRLFANLYKMKLVESGATPQPA